MAGFTTIQSYIDSFDSTGKSSYNSFARDLISVTTTASIWYDLALAAGQPISNSYGGTALNSALCPSGIAHGGNVSPATKVLASLTMIPTSISAVLTPAPYYLMDYLIYYPGLNLGSTSAQTLTTGTTLPRYTTGAGVRALVLCNAGSTSPVSVSISYTNSVGTAGQTSTITIPTAARVAGELISGYDTAVAGQDVPFMPLQSGDLGVRSVQSVTFGISGVGATSGVVVLVKPLVLLGLTAITATEFRYGNTTSILPTIVDGACLNFIVLPTGNATGRAIFGDITTVWN